MGTAWVAFESMPHRPVAIPFIRLEHWPLVRSRFAEEARATAQPQRPNVVQGHDCGLDRESGPPAPIVFKKPLSGP